MKYENRKFTLWRFLHEVLPDMVIHEIDNVYYIDYDREKGVDLVTATVRRPTPQRWNFHRTTGDSVKQVEIAAEKWEKYIEKEVTITWPPLPWEEENGSS
jgi:hypothetical protein